MGGEAMVGYVAQRGDAGAVTMSCAEQAASAARTAARAERQRLACDLHDSVTQTLISLQVTAQAVIDLWDTQPAQARAALDTVRYLATGTTTEMRALLVDLRDAVLEQQGLVSALAAYSAIVRQRSGLQVDLRVGEVDSGDRAGLQGPVEWLPRAHEEALYYLVREALANVVKHARATSATVTLERAAMLRVCVEDDGVGFGAPAGAFTYGLAGMRERVAALGGRLHLDNRPSGGARVVAELPLPDKPDR
jgi:signal transduction histidine kinase